MSRLTTHILDTDHGQTAAGMLVQLRRPPCDPPLLDCVVLCVKLTAPGANSHALLLLSPWIDSTNRGD